MPPNLMKEEPPEGSPVVKKRKRAPRCHWAPYRGEDGYYVCPKCEGQKRTFHNSSNMAKHLDRDHDGWRPPLKALVLRQKLAERQALLAEKEREVTKKSDMENYQRTRRPLQHQPHIRSLSVQAPKPSPGNFGRHVRASSVPTPASNPRQADYVLSGGYQRTKRAFQEPDVDSDYQQRLLPNQRAPRVVRGAVPGAVPVTASSVRSVDDTSPPGQPEYVYGGSYERSKKAFQQTEVDSNFQRRRLSHQLSPQGVSATAVELLPQKRQKRPHPGDSGPQSRMPLAPQWPGNAVSPERSGANPGLSVFRGLREAVLQVQESGMPADGSNKIMAGLQALACIFVEQPNEKEGPRQPDVSVAAAEVRVVDNEDNVNLAPSTVLHSGKNPPPPLVSSPFCIEDLLVEELVPSPGAPSDTSPATWQQETLLQLFDGDAEASTQGSFYQPVCSEDPDLCLDVKNTLNGLSSAFTWSTTMSSPDSPQPAVCVTQHMAPRRRVPTASGSSGLPSLARLPGHTEPVTSNFRPAPELIRDAVDMDVKYEHRRPLQQVPPKGRHSLGENAERIQIPYPSLPSPSPSPSLRPHSLQSVLSPSFDEFSQSSSFFC